MRLAAVATAGGLTSLGLLVVFWELLHTNTRLSTGLFTRLGTKHRQLDRIDRCLWGLGGAATLLVGLVSGRVIFGVMAGLTVVVARRLLTAPPQHDIEMLEALDRWVRALAATLPTGRSIIDALRVSRAQAPRLLQPALLEAVRRLDARWSVREALTAMADELDSADADAVLAALILAAERGGTGGAAVLAALADSVQERLRARREIEAERAKPRVVVRQITAITLALLGVALLGARDFFAPYATPLGQVVLAVLFAVYVGSLAMLRQMTIPRRRERILRRAG